MSIESLEHQIESPARSNMSVSNHSNPEEVEHLLRNAELRDQLEPLSDESIASVNVQHMPTPAENEFLADSRLRALPVSNAELVHAEYVVCLQEMRSLRVNDAFLGMVGASQKDTA